MSSLLVPSVWPMWELCLSKSMAGKPRRAGASLGRFSCFLISSATREVTYKLKKFRGLGGQGFLKAACFEGALSLVDGFSRGGRIV